MISNVYPGEDGICLTIVLINIVYIVCLLMLFTENKKICYSGAMNNKTPRDPNPRRSLRATIMASRLTTLEKAILWIMVDTAEQKSKRRTAAFFCGLTGRDIAWFASSTVATVTRVLARLRELDLIRSFPHPKDCRRQLHEIEVYTHVYDRVDGKN